MGMRKLLPLLLALLLPMAAAACGTGQMAKEGYENAQVEHAWQHWQQGGASPIPFVFIDVRTPEEYAAGHVPGARLLPLDQLASRLAEVPKDKRVYVYCHSGRRSAQAAALLATRGYDNIENVLGGFQAWKQSGYEVKQ